MPTQENFCAAGYGFLHGPLEGFCRALVDDRANAGVLVSGITAGIGAGQGEEAFREFRQHFPVHQNPPNCRAALPAVAETSFARQQSRQIEVRIIEHYQRRMSAKFQTDLFITSGTGDFLAHGGAASEGHQIHPLIPDQRTRDFIKAAMDAA